MSKVIEISEENFESEVLKSELPVLVDFWAPWCGPCRMMGPIVDEIAEENLELKVCKVNVDEASELAIKYDVESIPTLFILKMASKSYNDWVKNKTRYNERNIIIKNKLLVNIV